MTSGGHNNYQAHSHLFRSAVPILIANSDASRGSRASIRRLFSTLATVFVRLRSERSADQSLSRWPRRHAKQRRSENRCDARPTRPSTVDRRSVPPVAPATAQPRRIGNRSRSRKCGRPVFLSTATTARSPIFHSSASGAAAGNVLDNVNRWLGQLAQPPITADKLASTDSETAHRPR